MGELRQITGYSTTHVVLTHVDHKLGIISSSEILLNYWLKLEEALSEVDSILLFGYSGLDAHLNNVLKKFSIDRKVYIVEYAQNSLTKIDQEARFKFWKERIGVSPSVWWLQNVLEFRSWDYSN